MAENSYEFVAPVPVYTSNHELLSRLTKELQEEREKNFNLARDLALEKHKNQQLESYFLSISSREKKEDAEKNEGKNKLAKIESRETMGSLCELKDADTFIGAYSQKKRHEKIRKYKEKIKKYREKVYISRVFSGRSIIAKVKPRVNGKFVKSIPEESKEKE